MVDETNTDADIEGGSGNNFPTDVDPILASLVLAVKDGKLDAIPVWFMINGVLLDGTLVHSDQVFSEFLGSSSSEPVSDHSKEHLEDWQLIQKLSYCFLTGVRVVDRPENINIQTTRVKLAHVSAWGIGRAIVSEM